MTASATTQDNPARVLALLSEPYDIGPLGNLRQSAQPQLPCRSNSSWLGATLLGVALQASEVGTVVAVPVQAGDIVSRVTLPVGQTKGKGVENAFAALYEGHGTEPALVGQSKSVALKETVAAEKPLAFTLEEPVTVTAAMAPHGYIYVLVAMEAETMPNAIGVNCKTEAHKSLAALSANAPLVLAGKAGTGLKTTAKGKLESLAAVEPVPLVILT
jgi:hypothetical protein